MTFTAIFINSIKKKKALALGFLKRIFLFQLLNWNFKTKLFKKIFNNKTFNNTHTLHAPGKGIS